MKTTQITPNFTWHDAFFLPTWGVYHTPSGEEIKAIRQTCLIMEKIRSLLGHRPINVHCMIRPTSVNCPDSPFHGKNYNVAVGSTAKHSPHVYGMACDFDAQGLDCDDARFILEPSLDELGIRMEDRPGAAWIHIDSYTPSVSGGRRFFKA